MKKSNAALQTQVPLPELTPEADLSLPHGMWMEFEDSYITILSGSTASLEPAGMEQYPPMNC